MALTLIGAASGKGVILRDSHTRAEIYIAEAELITIGTALLRVATESQPRRRREQRH